MITHRTGWIALGLTTVALLAGCRERTVGATGGIPVALVNTPGSVMFRIEEQGSVRRGKAEIRIWLARYEANGKTARFQIKLALKPPEGNIPFAITDGTLYREPGSDSTVLLRDLAKALEAKAVPKMPVKQEKLPFHAAILGQDQSRGEGDRGGFSAQPKGTWITTKLFLADGEGEVYLNLDPAGGVGEFSIKDSDYGDIVLKELAKVL